MTQAYSNMGESFPQVSNISLQSTLIDVWSEHNIPQFYQNIFMKYIKNIPQKNAEIHMRQQIKSIRKQSSFIQLFLKCLEDKRKVEEFLTQCINTQEIKYQQIDFTNFCQHIYRLRQINYKASYYLQKIQEKYEEGEDVGRSSEKLYFQSFALKLDDFRKYLLKSPLTRYIVWEIDYDPFYMNMRQKNNQKDNKIIRDLFIIPLDQSFRFLKIKKVLLSWIHLTPKKNQVLLPQLADNQKYVDYSGIKQELIKQRSLDLQKLKKTVPNEPQLISIIPSPLRQSSASYESKEDSNKTRNYKYIPNGKQNDSSEMLSKIQKMFLLQNNQLELSNQFGESRYQSLMNAPFQLTEKRDRNSEEVGKIKRSRVCQLSRNIISNKLQSRNARFFTEGNEDLRQHQIYQRRPHKLESINFSGMNRTNYRRLNSHQDIYERQEEGLDSLCNKRRLQKSLMVNIMISPLNNKFERESMETRDKKDIKNVPRVKKEQLQRKNMGKQQQYKRDAQRQYRLRRERQSKQKEGRLRQVQPYQSKQFARQFNRNNSLSNNQSNPQNITNQNGQQSNQYNQNSNQRIGQGSQYTNKNNNNPNNRYGNDQRGNQLILNKQLGISTNQRYNSQQISKKSNLQHSLKTDVYNEDLNRANKQYRNSNNLKFEGDSVRQNNQFSQINKQSNGTMIYQYRTPINNQYSNYQENRQISNQQKNENLKNQLEIMNKTKQNTNVLQTNPKNSGNTEGNMKGTQSYNQGGEGYSEGNRQGNNKKSLYYEGNSSYLPKRSIVDEYNKSLQQARQKQLETKRNSQTNPAKMQASINNNGNTSQQVHQLTNQQYSLPAGLNNQAHPKSSQFNQQYSKEQLSSKNPQSNYTNEANRINKPEQTNNVNPTKQAQQVDKNVGSSRNNQISHSNERKGVNQDNRDQQYQRYNTANKQMDRRNQQPIQASNSKLERLNQNNSAFPYNQPSPKQYTQPINNSKAIEPKPQTTNSAISKVNPVTVQSNSNSNQLPNYYHSPGSKVQANNNSTRPNQIYSQSPNDPIHKNPENKKQGPLTQINQPVSNHDKAQNSGINAQTSKVEAKQQNSQPANLGKVQSNGNQMGNHSSQPQKNISQVISASKMNENEMLKQSTVGMNKANESSINSVQMSQKKNQQKQQQKKEQKKQIKLKIGKMNFKSFQQYIHSYSIHPKQKQLYDINKIIKQSEYQQTYLTQFLINNEPGALALSSLVPPQNNFAIRMWVVHESVSQNISTSLFKKYIELVQKSTTQPIFFFKGEQIEELAATDFKLKKEKLFVRQRTTKPRVIDKQFQNFIYVQCSQINFLQQQKEDVLFSQEIQKFTSQNSFPNDFLLITQDYSIPKELASLFKLNKRVQNFSKINQILENQDIDGYEINKSITITSIDVLRLLYNSQVKDPFTAGDGFFKFYGIEAINDNKTRLFFVNLTKNNGKYYFGTGFQNIAIFSKALKSDSTKRGSFCVPMFTKNLYGRLPKSLSKEKGYYGNWQFSLFWQDQMQGRIKHSSEKSFSFGGNPFFVALELEGTLLYSFEVNKDDSIF